MSRATDESVKELDIGLKMQRLQRLQAYIPESEYRAFLKALKKSGRYTSISDAIRDFIRDFNDKMGVKVVMEEYIDADCDAEVL